MVFGHESHAWFFLVAMVPGVLLLSLIQDMSKLVPFSLAADAVLLFGFVVITARALDQMAFAPPPDGDVVLANWSSFALFFGVVVSGFEGIALVVPMESNMGLAPATFTRLLTLCIVVVSLIFMLFGVLGYLAFGSAVEDVLTLNIEPTPLLNVVTLCICLGVVFTYPLQLFPVIDIVAEATGSNAPAHRKAIATALVATTALIAYILPRFGLLLSLIGNVGSATLSFILPALLHLHFFRKEPASNFVPQGFRYAIVAFGVTGGALGTFVSLHAICVEVFGWGAGHSASAHV
ncbi:aromatic and neutral amino acid transporter [Thecamonas trahens ATCC 50062]|uniref:Aromatic and neutral amino acid transporter n=1 Tax=Thecamonas trahens ATCC 50062 TaxID=461836 RepID=A0A0L0DIQ5_THETB|nr:aromatic and neutral amino acid transporter [Thecamonas trahens ATCC 50062]KNC52269.1 aromatic and neutral amino acid transporter [Thecamonas trahens ATCC 50062]|eukprot:XP_013762268.1 aromatic and neutral amino acid transporter [Thecamonas trahens ATCC 50062]